MKKTIKIIGAAVLSFFSMAVLAQETTMPQTEKPVEQKTAMPDTTDPWDASKNPVVQEIHAKYEAQMVKEKPALTTEDFFPAVGTYESTTNPEAASVVISLDPANKGIVWIEGLPQGKIKAMLRQSPAIYKIPAQKTEDGKDVAEGTLIFDKETNALSICIGKKYNNENPSLAFVQPETTDENAADDKKAKTKKSTEPMAWIYTATKVEKVTAMNAN